MKHSVQQTHILDVDSKDRITLPTDARYLFANIVYAKHISHGLNLYTTPREGYFSDFVLDTAGRITMRADIYALTFSTQTSPNTALWVPHRVAGEVSFLLLLGNEGAERWRKIVEGNDGTIR